MSDPIVLELPTGPRLTVRSTVGSKLAKAVAFPVSGAPAVPAPAWTTQPSISGTAQVSQTLTGNPGVITNGSATSYQWRRNGSAISGATLTTYVLQVADQGQTITFRVTATGAGGSSTATSSGVGPVAAAPDTTAPVLSAQSAATNGPTGSTSLVTTSELGGLLYAYFSTSATPPSVANHKTGTGAVAQVTQAVTASGVQTVTFTTGLTASTTYYVHFLHTDAAGNDSNRPNASFTTASAADTTAPTITSANPSGTYAEMVAIGGTLTANESVTWTKTGADNGLVTLNASTGVWSLATTNFETKTTYSWTFTATDGSGNATNQVVALTITDVDEIPNSFTFTDVTGALASTLYESNTITVAGLAAGVSVAVTITGGEYSKNSGAYTSSAGTVASGDTLKVRHTSSASNSTGVDTTLTIGGISDTFTTTTSAGGGGGYTFTNTEAATYVAAMTAQPDDTRKGLLDTLIGGLKTDGVWAKLDWLMLSASHDAQSALLNAKNPAKTAATINSPTFTANRGYTGDGATSYIDLGELQAAAGNVYVLDSAHMGAWVNQQTGTTSQSHFGTSGSATQNRSYFIVPSTGAETFRLNDGTSDTFRTADGNRLGHRLAVREGSAIKRAYYNGTLVADHTTVSTATPTSSGTVLRRGTVYSTDRVAAYHHGGGLTATEAANLRTRLNTYLTAIGAN